MYIKHNSIARSILLISAFSSQSFEVVTDLNFGMQTNNRQLEVENALSQNNFAEIVSIRQQASSSLGYVLPEYLDFELGIDFNPESDFHVAPKVNLRFINKRFDLGVKAAYESMLYRNSIRFSTYLDVYRSWFYDELSVHDHFPVEVDYGIEFGVAVNDFIDMRMNFVQPVVFGHSFKYKDHLLEVSNRNSVAIGLSWHLLADYGELADEYLHIIQEPIAIPRIDLVEQPTLADEKLDAAPVTLPADIEESTEPMGWFAWILEFLASLFRF